MKGIVANCEYVIVRHTISLLTLASVFDVVGILGRDLASMNRIVSETFDLQSSHRYPSKILYPTEFFPHSNPQQQAMVNEYVSVLEKFLGTEKTIFSLAERWPQCPPSEARGKGLDAYLGSESPSHRIDGLCAD